MKRFIILVAIAAITAGLLIGFGLQKLFTIAGANFFTPGSIMSIYGFGLLISFGFTMYWSVKHLIHKHRVQEKAKMREEIIQEMNLSSK